MKSLVALFLLSLFVGACVQSPTIMTDSDVGLLTRAYQFEKNSRPLKLSPQSVVLDTRSFFDHQLVHIPGSIAVDAKEFSLRHYHGEDLQKRAIVLARRLALWGINPFSHVVIVGYGPKGQGDEGVVGLTLLTLGVEQVQLGTLDDLKASLTSKPYPQRENVRYWEPRLVSSVSCPPPMGTDTAFVLSVGKKSFNTPVTTQKLAVIEKNWKDFVNLSEFSPNYGMKTQLTDVSVKEDSRLMVQGQQAPIAVFALVQLGYHRVCLLDD